MFCNGTLKVSLYLNCLKLKGYQGIQVDEIWEQNVIDLFLIERYRDGGSEGSWGRAGVPRIVKMQ